MLVHGSIDAAIMQRLGINTVRIYNVNPNVNHDMCMSIFNSVGIYVYVPPSPYLTRPLMFPL